MKEFREKIIELYASQEQDLKEKYDRSLSFQDGMFDRFERAKALGFGEGASIYNSALIYGAVSVGVKTWVGPNVILDGSGEGVVIGDYCSISAGVHIYTHDSVKWALSGGKSDYKKGAVRIGSCTYIGAQSIIKENITIGKHCVVGANSFVNSDLPDYSIAVGNPAKVIGRVAIKDGDVELQYDNNN